MEKIKLEADKVYIIRSTKTSPKGQVTVRYYETPSIWNTSPAEATIFRDFDVGCAHLNMYHERDAAPNGWADGSKEVLDVVPLYGEILNSPNAGNYIPAVAKKNRKKKK